jgi:hypothetical protein
LTSIGTTSIGLAWTEPAGSATSYELERGTSASGPWGAPLAVAGRSHTDTGLAPGTTYWYRVRAKNASGVAGAYCSALRDDARHGAGRADLFRGHATSLTLTWSPPRGRRGTTSNAPRVPAVPGHRSLRPSRPRPSRAALTPNTVYWYRISR